MQKLLIALIIMLTMASAVDLSGRIGMGLGFTPDMYDTGGFFGLGLGSVDIAVTRLALNSKWSVEPIAQIVYESNGTEGFYFALNGLGNMLLKSHSKTNVYAKIGLGFQVDDRLTETMFGFNLPFGFGLEHFINNHFSINLAALSGFAYVSNPGGASGDYFTLRLGNEKPFAIYLLWYY